MSKKQKRKGPKKKKPPRLEQIEYLKTMFQESDRGGILVGLAEIDDRLEDLLSCFLKANGPSNLAEWMLDPRAANRPLGNLMSRSVMARCLGFIDDELLGVIDELRDIRNKRAHTIAQFKLTVEDMNDVWKAWSDKSRVLLENDDGIWPDSVTPAMKMFIQSVSLVSMQLYARLYDLQKMVDGIGVAKSTGSESKGDDTSVD
jgi:hypothetical protein